MFGKNSAVSNNPQNKNLTTEEKINLSEDNFKLEDFPIHTMKEDLKELQNPSIKKETPIENVEPKKTFSFDTKPQNDLSEKNGPFFRPEPPKNQEKPANYAPKIAQTINEPLYFDESVELPKKIAVETPREIPTPAPRPISVPRVEEKINISPKEMPKIPQPTMQKTFQETPKENITKPHHGIGKAVAIAIVIFVILIASAGGYYFWMTRISVPSQQDIVIKEPETTLPEETLPEETTPIPNLSSKNSNYLQINLTQATTENLQQTLNEYKAKVLATNEIGVFEFLITDETNTPVTFQDFATTLGINLTPAISAQIGQDFSLYIYNYGDKTRFGLLLTALNDNFMKTALTKEEKNLPTSLSPLYPTITAPAISTFSSATYKNHTVRYTNITSADDYAIDYAIIGNKLVIGTTKATLFSSLDRLSE
ncbi:MAG: hypothetical protein US30_C0005G0016 [Candidatus Moranbacteria bacterium GW2011_GWF2_36_839]|nr:MAG: hypothetical protein US27_C0005G0038 [Candidatus Moranbacteria bacterium GW2011_GWF1_36_78]KKQ17203.1 MAG: hypothetical protein US30_C0005G0016 [Candidatus Moranbacteria bacterium GW2011_GWF2_36_839]HAT73722.1 hypothetical protein [Candidatus Moranbacteria bacterium]HBY11289.1 hypothetical protein [Candidatus Moranbacteria bacterium]